MTANGQPDNPRSARYILKDFVNGKLLYCHAPPGVSQSTYHTYPEKTRTDRPLPPREMRAIKASVDSTLNFKYTVIENNKFYYLFV